VPRVKRTLGAVLLAVIAIAVIAAVGTAIRLHLPAPAPAERPLRPFVPLKEPSDANAVPGSPLRAATSRIVPVILSPRLPLVERLRAVHGLAGMQNAGIDALDEARRALASRPAPSTDDRRVRSEIETVLAPHRSAKR
jgi:hypothetical protein